MLWEVDIYPAPGQPDLLGRPISIAAGELGLAPDLKVAAARSYLIQADWDRCQAERVAVELLTDTVVETVIVAQVGDEALNRMPREENTGQGEREQGEGEKGRRGGMRVSLSPLLPRSPSPFLPFFPLPPARPRSTQAGRHGPRGPERDVSDGRFRAEGRGGPHAEEILDRGH